MSNQAESSQNILRKKIEEFLSQGIDKFYLEEIAEKAQVSFQETEAYFLPLLKKNEIEGKLEVRCPNCEGHQGGFSKYTDIPRQMHCELCDHEFSRSDDYIDVVLEVKGKFFRPQKRKPEFDWTRSRKVRTEGNAARCYQRKKHHKQVEEI